MDYKNTLQRAWDQNRLTSVLLELTYACNWDCVFCYNDLNLKGAPLSKEQYFDLLADLSAMQVMYVSLSGGEPLAHPHFFAIGAEAKRLGFVVRVKSNAYALREPMARRLIDEIDPFLVEVSLHGATAETHDRQTRVKGSFKRLVTNLRTMRRMGLRIKVNVPLTQWNEHEITSIFSIADELQCPVQFDPQVSPRDNGDRSPLVLNASAQGIARLREVQRQRALAVSDASATQSVQGTQAKEVKNGPVYSPQKNCGAGSATLAIDPYGNIVPCVQWRQSIGNVHQLKVSDLWESDALRGVRSANVAARKMVDNLQEQGLSVYFCPGAAHTYSGDPLSDYPDFQRQRGEKSNRVRLPLLPL